MLQKLVLENFRCFGRVAIDLGGDSVGLVGPNAAGKTSVLEAVHFLGTGRSFRTSDRSQLLRRGAERLIVRADVDDAFGLTELRTAWTRESTTLSIGGRVADGLAEMAGRLRAHLIEPGIHRLIEGGPTERRRLLDMGVFHVEQQYAEAWRTFRRALRQRNAALRTASATRDARLWNDEFVRAAIAVDTFRSGYVGTWEQAFKATAGAFGLLSVALNYRPGWDRDRGLAESLEDAFERDVGVGYCTVGPQRADVPVMLQGRLAKRVVSRGQQKLLASALVLAQARVLISIGRPPLVLLDDPGAELDVDNLGKFLRFLGELPLQIMAAATFPGALEGLGELRWFHVKQDQIAPML